MSETETKRRTQFSFGNISSRYRNGGKKGVKTDRRRGVIFHMSEQQYRSDLREPEGKQNINIKER